ncbi:MAG: TIGR00269 family protein [Candidatus Anstonellales archaeon]
MFNVKCSSCNMPGAVYLPYMKKVLCESHFLSFFEKRVFRTIREFKMIRKGERIAIGYSGGKDSTVLLHVLSKLRKKHPFELVAITVDIGIPGYGDELVRTAKKECKKLNVEHRIVSFKKELGFTTFDIYKTGKSPCSYCGVFRRRLLNVAARECGADKLAIAHTLDDVAQTVLMNIMRNEPLRLIRLVEPIIDEEAFVPRIKPLLRTPEKEVVQYALIKDLPFQTKGCPGMRVAFRHEIRKMLNVLEEKHPGTKFRILNSFLSIEKLMRKGLGKEKLCIEKCEICGEPSSENVCVFCKMKKEIKETNTLKEISKEEYT